MENKRPTAVITGATSGIGKEFACRIAEQGFDLLITGRRKEELYNVSKSIMDNCHVNVKCMIGDLSTTRFRKRLCNKIKEIGDVGVLINNAGFGIDQSFYAIDIDNIRSMVLTHNLATAELTHTVLPGMMERRSGTIINVASLGAFMPGLTRSLYMGTKSFVHYFTEALSTEIKPLGIRIQSLCPGMTRSDFHRNTHNEKLEKKLQLIPFMSPEDVVRTSLKSLARGRILCIPGSVNKLFFVLAKLLPVRILMQIGGFRKDTLQVVQPHSYHTPVPCS